MFFSKLSPQREIVFWRNNVPRWCLFYSAKNLAFHGFFFARRSSVTQRALLGGSLLHFRQPWTNFECLWNKSWVFCRMLQASSKFRISALDRFLVSSVGFSIALRDSWLPWKIIYCSKRFLIALRDSWLQIKRCSGNLFPLSSRDDDRPSPWFVPV